MYCLTAAMRVKVLGYQGGFVDGSAGTGIGIAASNFKDARREHGSMLPGVEKSALIWMTQRAPAWVSSDGLIVLGLVALFFAGLGYWYARWNATGLVLVV